MLAWPAIGDPSPDFESEILPIFQRHCLACHGNESTRWRAKSRRRSLAFALGGHSGSPLLAQKLDQSELYLRVTSTTAGYRMPKQGKPLSGEELKTLAAWIQTTPPTAIAGQSQSASTTETKATRGNETTAAS